MKVNELRNSLAKYKKDDIIKLAVEIYKNVPKSHKTAAGLDGIITDYSKNNGKIVKKEVAVNFGAIKKEAEVFISNAAMDLYIAPNRIITKERRSKWRFEVKRFIKELVPIVGENCAAASDLLAQIYEMLCYACHFYIFNTDRPFSAVGCPQPDFLRLVLSKLFYNGYDADTVKRAVFLTLDSNEDQDTWHLSLLNVLVGTLKTPDTKEMALEACIAFRDEYDKIQRSKTRFRNAYDEKYRREEKYNQAAELYMILKFCLFEYDAGIDWFWKYYKERDPEISLYVLLLYHLSDKEFSHLWIREYEKAVARKITPRKRLAEEYAKRKAGTYRFSDDDDNGAAAADGDAGIGGSVDGGTQRTFLTISSFLDDDDDADDGDDADDD